LAKWTKDKGDNHGRKHQRRHSLARAAKKETLEDTPIGQSSKKGDIGGYSHWSKLHKRRHLKETSIGQDREKEDIGEDSHWSAAQKEALEETPIGQQHKRKYWRRLPLVRARKHKRMLLLVRESQKETPMARLISLRCSKSYFFSNGEE
jgi:hypothetical protein